MIKSCIENCTGGISVAAHDLLVKALEEEDVDRYIIIQSTAILDPIHGPMISRGQFEKLSQC